MLSIVLLPGMDGTGILISRASCDHIRKLLPGINVVEFEAPHLLLQTVPQDAANAIKNFVTSQIRNSN
jgi:hypothetical protein